MDKYIIKIILDFLFVDIKHPRIKRIRGFYNFQDTYNSNIRNFYNLNLLNKTWYSAVETYEKIPIAEGGIAVLRYST